MLGNSEKTLISNITAELRRLKWTLTDLARATGLTRSGLYKIAEGQRWPAPDNLDRIAAAFKREPGWLLQDHSKEVLPPSIATLAAEVDRQAAEIARLKRELERLEIPPAYRELVALVLTVDQAKVPALCDMIRMTLAGNPNGSLKPGKKLDHG